MFGIKKTDDQNNNASSPSGASSSQDNANLSIGGYVSPYMSATQDNSLTQSAAPVQAATPVSSPVTITPIQTASSVALEPVGQNTTVGLQTPVATSDNLLADPNQVSNILNSDGSSRYVVNNVVSASPTEPTNLGNNPLQTPVTSNQSFNSVLSQPAVSVTTPQPQSIEEVLQSNAETPTVGSIDALAPVDEEVAEVIPAEPMVQPAEEEDAPNLKDLNPEVDLAGVVTSGDEIVVKKQGGLHIKDYLDIVIEKNASDLHLTVGYPASIRIDSKLQRVGPDLTFEDVKTLIYETLGGNQKELLEVNKEVDMSYQHENKARFRVNAYNERGNLAAAYRLIPTKIRSIDELNIPPVLYDFTRIPQGLFLVTGPTGHGKSTTLAAMLQEINSNYPKHIVTIEDPIEYVYPKGKGLVDQRELGQDTHDWSIALRSILRQDPDVVLIGEMRDFETIQAAITIAETGHLVFATLHTNSAAQSIDRIIDVFPPHQQEQVRTQLAGSLKGILSQRLIPTIGGGRRAAVELMIVTPAIQNLIREGKTYQIDNIISTSFDIGMVSLERSLVRMVREGKITVETAQEYAIRPEEVLKLMKSGI